MARDTNGKRPGLPDERLRRVEREIVALRRDTNARLDQTNARLDETNTRLEQAVDVLTRLVGVAGAQRDKFDQLNERFDRLTDAILTGRTADTERVTGLEHRVKALEARVFGPGTPAT